MPVPVSGGLLMAVLINAYPLGLVEFLQQGNVSRLKSEDKAFDMLVRRRREIEPCNYTLVNFRKALVWNLQY